MIAGNFLGTRADKVCSGSDDGNFFVWDKDTGRLDGIWEADGHVVNGQSPFLSIHLLTPSHGTASYASHGRCERDRRYREDLLAIDEETFTFLLPAPPERYHHQG